MFKENSTKWLSGSLKNCFQSPPCHKLFKITIKIVYTFWGSEILCNPSGTFWDFVQSFRIILRFYAILQDHSEILCRLSGSFWDLVQSFRIFLRFCAQSFRIVPRFCAIFQVISWDLVQSSRIFLRFCAESFKIILRFWAISRYHSEILCNFPGSSWEFVQSSRIFLIFL